MEERTPLILCMENSRGEDVALRIEPGDDFQTFLMKAKSLLGFDVDINSITRNQPVSLTDNIYQFLINSEHNVTTELITENFEQILEPNNCEGDLVYMLDDGTQIRASQIHFDNEDPPVDLTAEKIPFVKYTDDAEEEFDNIQADTQVYNIVDSPVSRITAKNASPKCSFANSLPFRLVCNNTSGFEAQFTKYLEANNANTYATLNPVTNRNKSPRSLIRDNYKNYDDNFQSHRNNDDFTHYTREEILNMFKDSPVASLPYDNQSFPEKRKHVRKTDPSRIVHKNWNSKPISYVNVDGVLIAESESQNCFICDKYVDNNIEKLYLFDNEDQRLHRSSPQKKLSTQLKIICEMCLEDNFRPCRMKSPNQSLNSDEYLVIRNNQQYIFQKTNPLIFKSGYGNYSKAKINLETNLNGKEEFVKVEIGSDGEIVTKPIDADMTTDVIEVKDEEKESSSDVEIVENGPELDENIVDNLEEADDDVIEFLGKYQCDESELKELRCRFCERIFSDLQEVIDHGEEHKHDLDEGDVYPCPLCDYGYANFKWLKGHLKAAHDKAVIKDEVTNVDDKEGEGDVKHDIEKDIEDKKEFPVMTSPIAKRTRSAVKKCDTNGDNNQETAENTSHNIVTTNESNDFVIKTEVKQECLDSSDDEIWIVQTADDEGDQQLQHLLLAAQNGTDQNEDKKHKCDNCGQQFVLREGLASHKCKRKSRKRKSLSKDEAVICVPTQEDFIKRAQGRPRQVDDGDNDLLTVRARKKKAKEPSSDPQTVTCHNCNESFTSKVRLKFHMQFHDTTSMLTEDGEYTCTECTNAVFQTETELFDHVHFQHHKQTRWQCPVAGCGKTFYLRATLTKHSRTHTGTRRYVCGTCGKRFLDKQTLDEHGVTHLQIKPFQCHVCLKQLTRRSRLRMHLRAHEEELRPRHVLVCAICARAFRDANDVQEHLTRSPECIDEFANQLKEEEQAVTVQLSPTSGLVRHTVQITESPKLSRPIRAQVDGSIADSLLSQVSDEARAIVRVVEIEKAFRCEFCEDHHDSVESPKPSRPIRSQVDGSIADSLLSLVSDEVRAIVRVVEIEKAFRCEFCEDVFYSEDGLNNHRVIHKNVKNPFTCHICKVSFATYSRCTTHKTTHGFYKRPLADAKKQASKETHEAGPSATGILGYGDFPVVKHFLCEDCGRSYLHWTYLQVHRRMKHAQDNFVFKCNQCGLTFPNSWSAAYHRKKVHGKVEQDDATSTRTVKEKEDYKIPCRDCDEVLPNKTALYKHRKKEHSDASLRSHVTNTINNVKPGMCSEMVRARSPQRLARPACAKCGRSFDDLHLLTEHLKEVHSQSEPVPFLPRRSLVPTSQAHTQAQAHTHTHTRPHACAVCGHAFRTLSMLNEHLRIHTGERPFPCDVCGVAFRRSTAMRNHRLIHTGVRAWACARCPKRFRIRSDLRTHLRLKHPAHLAVIEVLGLNPSPEEVMEHLNLNNIPHDKVIEITKMSFTKGTTSIVPDSSRALSALSGVPRTQVACSRLRPERSFSVEEFQPSRRGRGIAKNPRRPKILQRGVAATSAEPSVYPIALNVGEQELAELNVQMLLRDGMLVNGNQMVQLQLSDSMMLE